MTSFPRRMWRAARLHADTYEEVEADRASLRQAMIVVLGACAATGGASAVGVAGGGLGAERAGFQVALAALEPLVLWLGGSAFAYMVGSSFFRGPETETDYAEVLRTTGFAFTPGLLRIFACAPPAALGLAVDLIARLWMFTAVVIALRQALDFTTARAVGTFGVAAALLWLVVWGLSVAPLPG